MKNENKIRVICNTRFGEMNFTEVYAEYIKAKFKIGKGRKREIER